MAQIARTNTAAAAQSELVVSELGNGDFRIVKGGDIYRKTRNGPVPDVVRAGETASAAEICEWMEFGALVRSIASTEASAS